MRGTYYPYYLRQRQRRPATSSILLECDSTNGCHARAPEEVQSEQEVEVSPIKVERPLTHSKFDASNMFRTADDKKNHDGNDMFYNTLNNIEELKELYRNCHASTANRFGYLLDCSHFNNMDRHHWSSSQRFSMGTGSPYLPYAGSHTGGLLDMVRRAPGLCALVLLSLLIFAIMLVETIDIFRRCSQRRRRSREEESIRIYCRLRRGDLKLSVITIYESSDTTQNAEKSA